MRIVTLNTNKKVMSIKNVGENYILETNDIVTELGELGQIQQLDGSFIDDTTPLPPQPPTEIEILKDQLKDSQQNTLLLNDTISSFVDYMFSSIPDLQ